VVSVSPTTFEIKESEGFTLKFELPVEIKVKPPDLVLKLVSVPSLVPAFK
jgi:hypothetical protein